MYEERRIATLRETMTLKATERLMLRRESRQVTMKETKMALGGTSQPGLTRFRKEANRSPQSHAKANIWREAVANLLMVLQTVMIMIMANVIVAPA